MSSLEDTSYNSEASNKDNKEEEILHSLSKLSIKSSDSLKEVHAKLLIYRKVLLKKRLLESKVTQVHSVSRDELVKKTQGAVAQLVEWLRVQLRLYCREMHPRREIRWLWLDTDLIDGQTLEANQTTVLNLISKWSVFLRPKENFIPIEDLDLRIEQHFFGYVGDLSTTSFFI